MESNNERSVRLSSGLHATYSLMDTEPVGVTWVTTPITKGNRLEVAYAYRQGENPFGTPREGAPYRRVLVAGRPSETTYWERM